MGQSTTTNGAIDARFDSMVGEVLAVAAIGRSFDVL